MQLSCSTAGSIEGPFQFSNSKFGGSGEFQAGGWRRSIPVQDKAVSKPQSSSAAQSSVTGSVDPVNKERAAVICPDLQTLRERERRLLNQQANRYLLHQQHAGILQVWRCLAQHQYQH